MKLVPVPNGAPPVAAAYQLMVPAEAVAPKTTVPVPHLELGLVPVIAGKAFTLTTVAVDTAL